ncbi:BatD family protein [Gramella sp. AN32]|uniref:BatD family protein n=1 Tax=Christiangramia antarctica TaxID=2058158 RepID=A0ABW5X3M6_9FLAO|nr:BatD family protein [Gramella sp. AN32]
MIKIISHIYTKYRGLSILCLILIFFSAEIHAQNAVSAEVDSTSIKIGEQISYKITVQSKPDELVVFPEGDTFSPLELVEASEVDTLRNNGYRLLREYFLTQFDSGKYVIPQQEVLIRDQSYFTDSIEVEVNNVVVDTTKQKLYPIKPSVDVSGGLRIPAWIWWLLGILLLGALVAFIIIRRKRKKDEEKELPPYEQAMAELENLDKSHLLENREIKQYYSQLSFSARKFLDRKIYDRGLESTTNELVAYLHSQKDQGSLNLSEEIIQDFEKILHRADLAKFANSKPDVITAKEDRSRTQKIIDALRISVPEPTEEELMMDEIYREELAKRRKRKRIIIGILAGVAVVIIGITALIATKGFAYVKDTYLGHPTKELLEGDWIRSEYGNPPVAITTPQVLKRGEIEMPPEIQQMMVGSETFVYGSMLGNFYTALTTIKFKGEVKFDMQKAIEGIYTNLEAKGAKNIIMKQEDFTTVNGAKGVKVFGTLDAINPVTGKNLPNEYVILNFAEKGGFEQVIVIHNQGDTYAQEITQRIINSVELNKQNN